MVTALVWIAVAAAVLSGFFALTGFALRSFSWVKLQEAFSSRRGPQRLERLDRHLRSLPHRPHRLPPALRFHG